MFEYLPYFLIALFLFVLTFLIVLWHLNNASEKQQLYNTIKALQVQNKHLNYKYNKLKAFVTSQNTIIATEKYIEEIESAK